MRQQYRKKQSIAVLMPEIAEVPFLYSQRFYLAGLACLGTTVVYSVRINLSIAILCMVRRSPRGGGSNGTNGNETAEELTTLDEHSGLISEVGGSRAATYCERISELDNDPSADRGEFDWDKATISQLLATFFWGYLLTQILSGYVSSRYGGTKVWGVGMIISGLCTILTPSFARIHIYLLFALRAAIGVASGVAFPCIHAILGQWAPPCELGKMAAIVYSGIAIGNVATLSSAGLLCQYGFDNGWGSIFYMTGIVTLIWSVVFLLVTSDSPAQSKFIKMDERLYIEASIGRSGIKKFAFQSDYVPWRAILTSGPVWAVIFAHFSNNYVFNTMITVLPTFLKESLNFNIKENGMLSSMPYFSEYFAALLIGFMADKITHNRLMSTTMIRKTFQCIAFMGTSLCMVGVAQVTTCERRYVAVALLCMSTAFITFNRAGMVVNHIDLAPNYAGILFGMTNTAGTIPGMLAPIMAGYLTPNKTTEEWKNVFYLCAIDALVGAVIYIILADGELQPWANAVDPKLKKPIAMADVEHDGDSKLEHKSSEIY